MNRVYTIPLSVAVAIGVIGCGPATPPPSPDGGGGMTETPAYWGFADQTCWTYDDGSGQNLYNIAIEEDTTTIQNMTTYHLTFRDSGLDQREDYLQIVKNTLVDWYHVDYPTNAAQVYWNYSPPPVILEQGLTVGGATTTMTMAMESTAAINMTVPLTFLVTNAGSSPVQAEGKMQSATELIVTTSQSNGSATADNFWFIPTVGIVQLQLSSQTTPWNLVKVGSNVSNMDCAPGT